MRLASFQWDKRIGGLFDTEKLLKRYFHRYSLFFSDIFSDLYKETPFLLVCLQISARFVKISGGKGAIG